MTALAAVLFAATFTRQLERVTTMDPAMSRTAYDSRAVRLVYEPLLTVDYEARPYRLVPGYCDLPEISADALTYRFRALHGPAKDAVASLERLRDPALVSPNSWIMGDVETVRAVGETVEIRLKRPIRYFPWLMSMPATAVVGADGDGTGPYRLKSWRRNHEMTFERRTPEPGGFDIVRYLVVDDASTQWLMFMNGELDMIGDVSRDCWDAIIRPDGGLDESLKARGIVLHSSPTMDVMYLGINMRDPVLGTNRKLRQALNAAFDFPAWEKFYNHRIVESDGPVPHGVEGRLETPFPYRFDLEKAKRLMREAGYPDGIDPKTGRRLVLTLTIGRANQDSRESGELMVAFFDRIGVKLELEFKTWDAYLRAINEGRVQMYRMGWVGDYPDAQNFLQLFYSPNASPGVNHSNYSNPEYDAAYERGDYRRCQEIVREDCPWVFTHFNMSNTLVNRRVGNYRPSDFPHGGESHYRVLETERQ